MKILRSSALIVGALWMLAVMVVQSAWKHIRELRTGKKEDRKLKKAVVSWTRSSPPSD